MTRPEESRDRELDLLLSRYRDACPDPEPSVNFMPRLWEKIESRQRFVLRLRRWTQGFVTAAAAASLLLAVLQVLPKDRAVVYSATYLEALVDDPSADALPFQDVAFAGEPRDPRPESWQRERGER